ncbi:MAG: metalloregulator ArsR/SmtB family transcription factor [Ornithinimicrobium sp.]
MGEPEGFDAAGDSRRVSRASGSLTPEHAVMLARSLKVLANSTRLQLLSVLLAQLDGKANVGTLTEAVGLRQPTVTHHLGLMFEAGLLEREPRGRQVMYSVHPDIRDTISDLIG